MAIGPIRKPGIKKAAPKTVARRKAALKKLLSKSHPAFAGRLTRLEKLCENSSSASVCVPISTLAPEPFDVIKNFYVVVQSEEDCYVATLFDANISSSGDSQEEAVANVIDLTVMIFRSLENEDDSKLGPAIVRQKHALQSLIRRS